MEMVTSVAARWGYTDLSRFGALHKARYRETPAVTPESASQKYLTTSLAVLQWYSAEEWATMKNGAVHESRSRQ